MATGRIRLPDGPQGLFISTCQGRSFIMNALVSRSGLFDDFFKDFAPAFYVRPLHLLAYEA